MAEYEKKLARIKKAFAHEEPDRVPIVSHAESFAIAYGGATGQQVLDDMDYEWEVYARLLQDVYFDGTITFGLGRPMKAMQVLGGDDYTFAGDGTTLQRRDVNCLPAEEIEEFIANPMQYVRDKALYRKFPKLRKPAPENYQALEQAFRIAIAYIQKQGGVQEFLRENCDTPILCAGPVGSCAVDTYSFFRGFTNTLTDLRRRPELTMKAFEAVDDNLIGLEPGTKFEDYPFVYWPTVVPAYLNRKHFEKYYWPWFKRSMDAYCEAGAKVVLVAEGKWEHYFDYLKEFPKGFLCISVDEDDIVAVKKAVGDTVAVLGGLPLHLLKNGTREQCIDETKRLIDECAPGGGFMLSTCKALIGPNDISAENLKAVNEFAREYGRH